MKTQFYLVVNRGGSVKAVKNRPGLDWDQIAVQMNLELPNSLFEKPQLQASLKVSDGEVSPTEIDVETVDNIRDAIETTTGFEVKLTVLNNTEA